MLEYPQGVWNRHQTRPLPHTIEITRVAVGALLLEDFKAHLRVSGTAEDTALTRFLDTAARALEDDARRLLLTGTVKEYFDVWPWDYLEVLQLTRAPVVSLTSVKYYDPADVLQTWASSNYATDLVNEPARVVLAELATLTSPSVDQRPNAVVVEYQCGYGAAVSNLAPEIINAVFVKAAYLYARGRELGTAAEAEAVERCWQNEIRRLTWSML
jgi:uncharacterized phiE125 gp8 family phage protein